MNHGMPGITRERSFVRTSGQNMQNANKRRSLALQQQQQQNQQTRDVRADGTTINSMSSGPSSGNKLNVHAQEFTMSRNDIQQSNRHMQSYQHQHLGNHQLQQSKSTSNMNPHMYHMSLARMQQQQTRPLIYNQMQMMSQQNHHLPLIASPSTGNVLQQRVKFAPDPVTIIHPPNMQHQPNQQQHHYANQNHHHQQQLQHQQSAMKIPNPLQRSKSLTSADNLITRSLAGMSLSIPADVTDIGPFSQEIQSMIDKAVIDPNELPARSLMNLATHIMERAIEGRRYSLPVSRLCIQIIAKEKKETFLEALLNTCRQWYNERDKVLGAPPGSKIPARPKFTSFMSFLTEMFSQLKRRQLQLRTHCDGAPPPLVLLTLLEKCCEDCVKPPVRSLSEIECLFFVLTCIGRDLEQHLPQQLEILLNAVRDAFLNSSASAPAIRRTLLQLIELQASRWQLPGNTVLYYYPTQRQNTMTSN